MAISESEIYISGICNVFFFLKCFTGNKERKEK